MDTIKELSASVRDYLRDRTSNPIYGAFVVSWVVLNFRVLLVVFGDGSARDKIQYLDERLYPAPQHWAWYGFGYPLLLATLFVVASPFVRRWVTLFLRRRENETLTAMLKVEGETPLSREQADLLRRAIAAERVRRVKEREEANREIDELRRQLELAATEAVKARPDIAPDFDAGNPVVPTDNDQLYLAEDDFVGLGQDSIIKAARRGISRLQAELLYTLRNGHKLTIGDLAKQMNLPEHHAVKVLLDQLQGLQMVELDSNARGLVYTITSAGTQALQAVTNRGFNGAASVARRSAN